MLAGACSVLQSAWYVENDCKTVFFCKFYDSMTTKGLDVAQVTHAQAHMTTPAHYSYYVTMRQFWTKMFALSHHNFFLSPFFFPSYLSLSHPMPALSLSVFLLPFLTHLSLDLEHVHPHRHYMLRSIGCAAPQCSNICVAGPRSGKASRGTVFPFAPSLFAFA